MIHESHAVAPGGDRRAVPAADLHRRRLGSVDGDAPDGLLGARRIARRVGDVALAVGAAAADVDQALAVRRPLEAAELLAVVLGVAGDLPPLVVRGLGHPEIAD